jgi:X-X-X-Leu-X-X-Gly heptad repeat protein
LQENLGVLNQATKTMTSSLTKLTEGSKKLLEGANTISVGVNALAEGITKFNNEGIETICNYINGDIKDVQTKLEKL